MKSKNKKAQAALEFLVTYGWAILGVMIVIGVLTYFGLFNTSKYTNDECNFGDQLKCEDYILHQDGWVAFKLRNNFGVPITITKVMITSDYGTALCGGGQVNAGSIIEVWNGSCRISSGSLPINEKAKIKALVEFKRTGSSNLHNQTGDMTAAVQKESTCSDGVINCHGASCETKFVCDDPAQGECGGPCGNCPICA